MWRKSHVVSFAVNYHDEVVLIHRGKQPETSVTIVTAPRHKPGTSRIQS